MNIRWYQEMGVEHLVSNEKRNYKKLKTTPKEVVSVEQESRRIADSCNSLEELKKAVHEFKGLKITETAINTVFCDGNPSAPFMAIGEAPGANEDEQGIPFCGVSGQLLDKFLSFIGLTRAENLYITNSVFWRPPGNRKPTEEENQICLPFLEKHIALKKPKLLILVGATSAAALLGKQQPITTLRHQYFDYTNRYMDYTVKAAAIFHPSYLLRQPSQKKLMWFDLLKIKENFLS